MAQDAKPGVKPEHRLRSPRDFQRVLRDGRAVARPEFVLYHLSRDGQDRPRVGFGVSRRIGGAVVRNRTKRLLREAVRPLLPRLRAGTDVVVVAREAVVGARLSELTSTMEETATRAGLIRTPKREEGTPT